MFICQKAAVRKERKCACLKRFIIMCICLWGLSYIIPYLALNNVKGDIPQLPIPTAAPEKEAENLSDKAVGVTLNNNGKIEEIPLDEYLCGVVAAEMPALFPDEALKAQAVAARTYTMKRIAAAPAAEHGGAAVCSNPSHCKAYKPLASFAASWDTSAEEYSSKIMRAVRDTDGEVVLYNGEPITAVFHSTSAGKTENSADVWGGNVPYLVSVESPGEEASPRFEEEKELAPAEFKETFLKKYAAADFDINPENWITNISRSDAGGVKSINIAGVSVKGSDVRSLFGLNSTNFTIRYDDGKMKIKTRGYGHGVGMSQYGARAMALEGKNYEEILLKYYTGTQLGKISEKASS